MKKFNNKYRIDSTRLKNYDYSQRNAYFITMVTDQRTHFFGEIINNEMVLSNIGNIAYTEWQNTLNLRPDMNLILDEFVVMPNHIHGIIIINDNKYNIQNHTEEYKNEFGSQSKNIASIIRGYKSAVNSKSKKINIDFDWQANYHDRIIRNEKEFENIKKYINKNPLNWKEDDFSKPLNPFLFDCNICKTRCDGKSKGVYNFKNDVDFAEEQEQLIIDKINKNPNYFARKTKEAGYPDIEIFNKNNELVSYLEIKAQRRTFMSVERILPQSKLKPSETLALNLSDLKRYFLIEEQTKTPISILWVLMNRPCIITDNDKRFFYQKTTKLKEIYQNEQNKRKFRRESGKGDIVNGIHKGVTVNYHFSINELKEWKS